MLSTINSVKFQREKKGCQNKDEKRYTNINHKKAGISTPISAKIWL